MRIELTQQEHEVTDNVTITHAYHIVQDDEGNDVEVKHEFQNAIVAGNGHRIGFASNIIAFETLE